jgi:hypothetical protein
MRFWRIWEGRDVRRRIKRKNLITPDITLYYQNRDTFINTLMPNNLFSLFMDTPSYYDSFLHHKGKQKKRHLARHLIDHKYKYYFLDPTYDRVSFTSPLMNFELVELVSFWGLFFFGLFYIFAIFRIHIFFSWLLNYLDRSDRLQLRVILGPKLFHYLITKPLPLFTLLKFSLIPLLLLLFFKLPFFFFLRPLNLTYFRSKKVPYNEDGTLVAPLKRPLQRYRQKRKRYKKRNKRQRRRYRRYRGRVRRRRRAKRKRKRKNKYRYRRRLAKRRFNLDLNGGLYD